MFSVVFSSISLTIHNIQFTFLSLSKHWVNIIYASQENIQTDVLKCYHLYLQA